MDGDSSVIGWGDPEEWGEGLGRFYQGSACKKLSMVCCCRSGIVCFS